jgi:hypothetical protein
LYRWIVVARRNTAKNFVQLDVDIHDNARLIRAGEGAELLYIIALAFCKRTLSDGFIADDQLRVLRIRDTRKRAARLVDEGLWRRVDGGYVCAGWSERNASRDEVEQISAARAEAGRKGGERSGQVRAAQAEADSFDDRSSLLPETKQTANIESKSNVDTDSSSSLPGQQGADEDDDDEVASRAFGIIAQRRLADRPGHLSRVSDRTRWLRATSASVRQEYEAQATAILSLEHLDAEELALRLEPSKAQSAAAKACASCGGSLQYGQARYAGLDICLDCHGSATLQPGGPDPRYTSAYGPDGTPM